MSQRKFKQGDFVKNINPNSVYYGKIKDKIGVFRGYWSSLYTLNNACDVEYPGVTDLYERVNLAQSAHDLEFVEGFTPSDNEPFDWPIDGHIARVHAEWHTCGKSECKNCYPPSGKVYHSHGPYYLARWRENGKAQRKYLGTKLPPLPGSIPSNLLRRVK